MPDDAGVLQQFLDLRRLVARDFLRLEAVKGFAEVFALTENRDPGKPGLKPVEDQLLEKRPVVIFGNAPFLVVIGNL